jgi:hypothetical protein
MASFNDSSSEVIFFLGAGASIPAGISGVECMVYKFLEKLKTEYGDSHFEIANDIFTLLSEWKKERNEVVVDIELMLETIERLENRDLDVVPLFYNQKKKVLENFGNVEKSITTKLSSILKQFIKSETGKSDIQVDYLKGLLKFMKASRPLCVFSTNYDICIERFCLMNKKTFFDGFFNNKWDPIRFANRDLDLILYKLHGSITWWRDKRGRYTRNEIRVIDTEQPQKNIITGEKEVPLISYPGRKLEYFECTFDLIVELKNRLNNPNLKYIFVVGYSFRDDHIRRLVQYASERNHEFILFLIGPSAHEIYENNLKCYKDMDTVYSFTYNSFTESSFNIDKPSNLIGRVIRVPYKIENIVDSLNDVYLVEVKNGLAQEIIENEKDQNQVVRWDECLRHFIACEYFQKVEQIIEERMGGLDALMKSDYNLYELGWEIILKSLLNVLFLDQERDKWSQRFKKYLTNLANNIEVRLHDQSRSPYIRFEYSQDWPKKLGSDIYGLFKHLFKIYDTHPIFSNYGALEKIDLTRLKIGEICDYFSTWQNNIISFQDYIRLRQSKYPKDIVAVRNFANDTSRDTNDFISAVKEIERKELLGLCSP